MQFLLRFSSNDDGATAVEYVVMLALIVGVMILTLTVTGHETSQLWNGINGELQARW